MTTQVKVSGPPDWLAQALDVKPMDVRPVLANGEDPFALVVAHSSGVADGGTMVIDAPFNPSPLRKALAGRGFSSYARKLAEGHWRVFFRKDGAADWERHAEVGVLPEGAFIWEEDDGIHIDVRKLQPPQPMLAVLRVLEAEDGARQVIVHHERMPHFLLPELAERGWAVARAAEEFANVRLWLERKR